MSTQKADHELRIDAHGNASCTGCEWASVALAGDGVTKSTGDLILAFTGHFAVVGNASKSMWAPDPSQLFWLGKHLNLFRSGGVWGIPDCGAALQVLHETKTMLVIADAGGDPVLLDRTATVARLIGWKFEPLQVGE